MLIVVPCSGQNQNSNYKQKAIYRLNYVKDKIIFLPENITKVPYGSPMQYSVRVPHVTNIVKSPAGFICYNNPILNRKRYGKQVEDLLLCDETGEIKSVLHYRTINIKSIPPFIHKAILKRYKDKVFFYPPFQDTIFSISGEKMNAEFVLNRGKYAIDFEDVDELSKMQSAYEKGIVVNNFHINDKCLLLSCSKNNILGLYIYNLSTKKLIHTPKLTNNIDRTFDIVYPLITDTQMLEVMDAFRLVDENKTPESLPNLDPDNNPVIRIASLKPQMTE